MSTNASRTRGVNSVNSDDNDSDDDAHASEVTDRAAHAGAGAAAASRAPAGSTEAAEARARGDHASPSNPTANGHGTSGSSGESAHHTASRGGRQFVSRVWGDHHHHHHERDSGSESASAEHNAGLADQAEATSQLDVQDVKKELAALRAEMKTMMAMLSSGQRSPATSEPKKVRNDRRGLVHASSDRNAFSLSAPCMPACAGSRRCSHQVTQLKSSRCHPHHVCFTATFGPEAVERCKAHYPTLFQKTMDNLLHLIFVRLRAGQISGTR
jgi:hypothetical protein